ncbi:uncharacterized protein LOC144918989 isoform X2 [Branchiostoma floridae x Branchiostoma belcheri]
MLPILPFCVFVCFAAASATIDLDTAGQYKCSFDDSVCDWTVEGPVNHGGGLAGCDHGWPNDALTGATDPGAYVCFFLESLPSQYPGLGRARLISPTINVTQHVVLGFSVGTVRPPTSTYLRVLLVNETGTNGTETLMCSTSDLLLPFQRIYVGIVQPGPYKIVIEGIPDPPFYPNFGIDELTLTAVQNATANVGVQTTTCSTELVTTPRMTTRQYNTTLPMTSSQEDTTMSMTSSQGTTTLSVTSSQDTNTHPVTTIQDTTTQPMTSSQDTTTQPMTIDLDTAGQYRCSLDTSLCDWTIEGPVYHGGPAGCDHGWPNETLHGATAPGMYVCFYLENLPSQFPGAGRARLISPTITVTQHVVLGFSVGTVRPPTSTYLRVLLMNETGTNGTETLLCSTSDLLSPFQRLYIGIVEPGPYRIVIEGIPDPPFYPNFGMDELTLTAVENATANVGVQTTTCSTELVTTPRMTTRQYNTTLPMTSSQDDTTMPVAVSQITTTFSQTSSQQPMTISKNTPTTILPTTDSQVDTSSQDTAVLPTTSRPDSDTTILPMTSSKDTTVLPMTSSKDTTVLPKTSSHDTTILPMTDSQDTTVLPMTGSQDTTVLSKTSSHDTTIMAMTSSQDTATLPITTSQDTTHKATSPEVTTKRPIPPKTPLTTSKSEDVTTKFLPTTSTSKEGQLGQQSGRNDTPDITAVPIVLGIAGFLLVAGGGMFYLRKMRNKRSNFSVEESRRASRMSLTQTELTQL